VSETAILVKNVKKKFGKVVALNGVSIEVEKGKVYGLLGPNGAGKTTLVRILATLLKPDTGKVELDGKSVVNAGPAIRELIGLAGQFAAVDDYLTGRETLEMVARLYHLSRKESRKRAQDIINSLSLAEVADRPAKTYSGGMRRRLDLGAGLVGRPDILLLDEPTTGLDPRTRQELWGLIRNLAKEGRTIMLTTQYLEEADALCNYIAIIDHGKVVRQGTSAQLKSSLGADIVELQVQSKDQAKAKEIMRQVSNTEPRFDEATEALSISSAKASELLLSLAQELKKDRIKPTNLALHRPSLDDVFLAVTGKKTKPRVKASK